MTAGQGRRGNETHADLRIFKAAHPILPNWNTCAVKRHPQSSGLTPPVRGLAGRSTPAVIDDLTKREERRQVAVSGRAVPPHRPAPRLRTVIRAYADRDDAAHQ